MQDIRSHKQAFWFTLINYLGIFIGMLFTLFLYPYDYAFYGEVAYVDSLAQIVYPILVFGGSQALIHFYPTLTTENKKKLFKYGIRTIWIVFVFLVVILAFFSSFFNWDKFHYLLFGLPLALLMAFIDLFKRQAANLQRIVVPTFYEKIIPKLALPFIFILFLGSFISVSIAFSGFIGFYLVLLLLLSQYLFRYFSIKTSAGFSSLFSEISKKEYFQYCFFAFVGSFGSFLAFRVDGLMIPEFLNFEANGAYRNAVNFATAMAIPATGLFTIYGPQISNFIKKNDLETLQMKYIETAKLLFFIGAIILGCVVVGAKPFFSLLPTSEKLLPILPVIYILATNVLFNMATGFNSEIISYSKFYKFNILAVLILVVVNVLLNYIFLTLTNFGIVGVSIATLISLVLFNVAKLIFIYKKIGLFPFDRKYAYLILVLSFVVVTATILPVFSNVWIEIIVKVAFVLLFSIVLVYQLKLVPTLNYWFKKMRKK